MTLDEVDLSHSSAKKATNPSTSSDPPQSESQKAIDYEGYVKLSESNRWEHRNPIERFEYLNKVYSQSYAITQQTCDKLTHGLNQSSATLQSSDADKQLSNFLAYVKKDLTFVIQALVSTSPKSVKRAYPRTIVHPRTQKRVFDLTPVLIDALEGSNRLMFKIIKEVIRKCGMG